MLIFNLLCFLMGVHYAFTSDDVLELTDQDFSTRIREYDAVLVMFYAPWCGHCKIIKLEFEIAATLLLNDDPRIALAEVDCTEAGEETCNKFAVPGYPTLKIFRGEEVSIEYQGPREASGIVQYMKAQVGPQSTNK